MEWAIEHGGEVPDELVDIELMEAFGLDWHQVQATPHYVRQLMWLQQQMKRAAQKKAQERAEQG